MDLKPTRLFLVRHGETEWNAAKRFQGHLDSQLTAAGLEQAARLAARLEGEGITAIYSSDQGRAMRTAEVVARKLGLTVVPRLDLREIDCGDWTGMSYVDVHARWPEEHTNWSQRPHLHCMPNGESTGDVQARALKFLEYVRRNHPGESICAVSHHTIVRSVACYLLGWQLDRLWEGPRQANCAVNLIEIRNGTTELVTLADTAHLDSHQVSAISFQEKDDRGRVV